jgi:hypothetical protein
LGFVEAVHTFTPLPSTPHAGAGGGLIVVEVGGAAGLFGGDAPQAHALVGEEHRGAGQQELAELEDWIEAPTLKEQNAAAEEAHGGKKHVVVARQGWLEAPHEVEEGSANSQHNADNAGPIQAGVNHRSRGPVLPL